MTIRVQHTMVCVCVCLLDYQIAMPHMEVARNITKLAIETQEGVGCTISRKLSVREEP